MQWSEPIRIDNVKERQLMWPLIATPWGNGVRYLTDLTGTARNVNGAEPINNYVREQIIEYGMDGMDGWIQVAGGQCPLDAVNALAQKDGELDFEYFVYDLANTEKMYKDRCNLDEMLPKPRPPWLKLAEPVTITDAEGAENYWKAMCLKGHAGVSFKKTGCMYIVGSLPWNFQHHILYSKWQVGLATAVGFVGEGNELRYITCEDPVTKRTFNVAHGFTPQQRLDFWKDRQVYTKFALRYEFQDLGTDVPLNPRFKKLSKR